VKTFAGDTAGLGARISRNGNASHRGHGGHRGGTWVSAGNFCRGIVDLRSRITRKGNASHRGHGGHRGGTWVSAGNFCRGIVGLRARISRNGNASHRGHRGHRGGLGLVRETFAGDTVGLGARISRNGNASHRGHRGHRGGTWISAGNFCRGHRWPGCENPPNGKASMILRFTARKPPFHQNNFQRPPNFPLCGLCAMLSPLRVAPAQCRVLGVRCCEGSGVLSHLEAAVFIKTISIAPPQFSPSVTSVTSVRCFPSSRSSRNESPVLGVRCCEGSGVLSRPEAAVSPKQFSMPHPYFPLCDLCGLCAMLSPLRVVLAHCRVLGVRRCGGSGVLSHPCSPKEFLPPTPDFPSVTSLASVTSVRCFPLFA
jgi:hypothetical protein